jgi:hypothetical protein
MDFSEMKEKLEDIYDLNKVDDCRQVIQILLRDLQRRCEESCHDSLKVLAQMVLADNPKAKEVARKVEDGLKPRTTEQLVKFLKRMSESSDKVEHLTREELIEEGIKLWSRLSMDSWESAVLDEMIQRIKKARGFADDVAVDSYGAKTEQKGEK